MTATVHTTPRLSTIEGACAIIRHYADCGCEYRADGLLASPCEPHFRDATRKAAAAMEASRQGRRLEGAIVEDAEGSHFRVRYVNRSTGLFLIQPVSGNPRDGWVRAGRQVWDSPAGYSLI